MVANGINRPFSEIIESGLGYFVAQCWEWDNFPEFGDLLHVESNGSMIVGCVTNINTGSIDPMRTPFPYKKTEEQLRVEQPHIFEFLRTTYTAISVGYVNNNKILYHLPSQPCKIHSFVSPCLDDFESIFLGNIDFLDLLFTLSSRVEYFDELLLVLINKLNKAHTISSEFIDAFYKKLSLLTGNDYRRLKIFFARVEALHG